ncbi:hypothetical protein Pyn_26513 [Prunus yedoensis var. nudiflora]|uniref:Uncharacterized protein n=1 Tax=Prunus yedoensis var. nudiflora TaxID=2094558 RepID=A0A314XVJ3_PRUYE|nr:hypothetical protein Pyn_26513 [Prunus yedoensis var. nudiflora]
MALSLRLHTLLCRSLPPEALETWMKQGWCRRGCGWNWLGSSFSFMSATFSSSCRARKFCKAGLLPFPILWNLQAWA